MKNYLIDTHAHIDMLPLDETLNLMQEYNVKKAIIPSVEIGTMDKVLEIANNNENIFAMLGIFPSEAKTYTNEVEEKIRANVDKIVAIGEIGLDYTKKSKEDVMCQKKFLLNKLDLQTNLVYQ